MMRGDLAARVSPSHLLPQPRKLRMELACLALREPCTAPPFALPDPRGGTPDHNAGNEDAEQEGEQRRRNDQGWLRLVERIEGDGNRLAICDSKGDKQDGNRNED